MAFEDDFKPGMRSIPAIALKRVARAAARTEGVEAPIGGTLVPPETAAVTIIPIFVIARTVDAPAMLHHHGYTIRAEGNDYEVSWESLWTMMPFSLVDPGAQQNAMFAPAAVVGDGVHAISPHRAQGLLYRMPGTVDGKSTAMVWLWGLSMVLGCEAV